MRAQFFIPILITVFLLGLWQGRRTSNDRVVQNPSRQISVDEETRSILQSAADAIKNAKTEDERRQKTDELLEKIFKLFLIDVSLRLEKSPSPPAPVPATADAHPMSAPGPESEPPVESENPKTDSKSAANRRRQLEIRIVNSDDPRAVGRALG